MFFFCPNTNFSREQTIITFNERHILITRYLFAFLSVGSYKVLNNGTVTALPSTTWYAMGSIQRHDGLLWRQDVLAPFQH